MNKSILSLATMMAVASNVDAANGTGQQNSTQQNKRPNIIFFLVDDMGWQDTSLPFWTQKLTIMRCTKRQTWSDLQRGA